MRLLLFITLAVFAMSAPADEEALKAGETWLSLVDTQKYDESWKQAGAIFRNDVEPQKWSTALKQSRDPLGELVSRKPSKVDATKTLRGAPDGEYIVVHYGTNFKNKSGVTERLTLAKEDGKWQVFSYAIH